MPDTCVAHNGRGEALKARLNDMFMRYQAAMQVTGVGSLLTLHPLVARFRRRKTRRRPISASSV